MKTFRPGATLWPLLVWTLLVGAAAFFVERHALSLPRGTEQRWLYQLLFAACIVLGPLAFVAHLARRLLVSVAIDPERGLILNGRRQIPWGAIESVEHRAGPFRGARSLDMIPGDATGEGCLWVGAFAPEGCAVAVGVWIVAVVLFYIFLPVFSLLSPWHARVTVRLKDGGRMVFRDLENDEEFLALVRRRLP